MRRTPAGLVHQRSDQDGPAARDLVRQQADRLWNADTDLDWSIDPSVPESKREPWLALLKVFYSLELMGLDTLQVMTSKAGRKLQQPEFKLYPAAQSYDEARHVYALDKYLERSGAQRRQSRLEPTLIDRYGRLASWGPYSVENWLISTLFSENFAALFLERAVSLPDNDPLARDLFRLILRDEARHVNFPNVVLPGLIGEPSRLGRAYLWQSPMMIAGFASIGMRLVAPYAGAIGIDIEDFKTQLVANLNNQYEDCGIDDFLHAYTSRRVMDWLV